MQAAQDLAPAIYPELKQLALSHLRREARKHSFQPTELVHEVYLRLMKQPHPEWKSRKHFYFVASRLMRQILVDQARRLLAVKRGEGQIATSPDSKAARTGRFFDLLRLEEALLSLEVVDARKARFVELYYFSGLNSEEIAELQEISAITVRRDLRLACAWLRTWLTK